MTPEQEKLLNEIAGLWRKLELSDRYFFQKDIALASNRNIKVSGNGSSFGTRTTDKVSLYGVTPIVQQAAISQPSGGATVDSQSRTAINSIITALQNIGITA